MAELIYFHVTLVKQNSAAKHEYAKIKQLAMPNIVISVCSLSKEGLGTNLPTDTKRQPARAKNSVPSKYNY